MLGHLLVIVFVVAGGQLQQSVGKPVLSAPPQQAQTPVPASPASQENTSPKPATGTAVSGMDRAVPVSPTYVLGPSDEISVSVWHQQNFSGSFMLRPDGVISVPLIGEITASGLTPVQLSNEIANRLKKYVNDPLVTVSVQAVNSKRIYLVGEIGHIGPLAMTPGMTPLEAIATAGGISPYGNAKRIYILRNLNGKEQKIPFNYRKAVKDGNMQGVQLQPGDTIVVP